MWLHTTVLSRENTKKLHHPWTGPYCVIKRLSDSTYRIQLLWAPHKLLVVHFNRLKPCGDAPEGSPAADDTSVSGEPVPEPPVTRSRLGVVEPEDIPVRSEPHHPSPPFPLSTKAIYINEDTLPKTASPLTDSVIWFLHESIKNPGHI